MAYYNRMPDFGNATSPVPSFGNEIDSLGATVDKIAANQIRLAQMERQAKVDADRDAYYRGRNAVADKKEARAQRTLYVKDRLEALKQIRNNPGAGPVAYPDEQGEYHIISPEFVRAPTAPAAEVQPEAAPEPAGRLQLDEPFSKPPGARPGPDGLQLRPPMFGPIEQPQEPQEPQPQAQNAEVTQVQPPVVRGVRETQGETVFLDENNDGDVRGLTGPDDATKLSLAEDSFPPGAREGDRFETNDVGMEGRKGNPHAEAMPPEPMPDVQRQSIPEGGLNLAGPQAEVTAVPPTQVQGALFDSRTQQEPPKGDHWRARLPDGSYVYVDVEQQRQAKRAEQEALLAQIQEARKLVSDDPALDRQLALREAMVRGGLSEKPASQGIALAHKTTEREGSEAFKGAEADKNRAFQGEQKGLDRASREKVASLRKAKGGGGRGSNSSGPGSAYSKLKPADQEKVDRSVNAGLRRLNAEMNWNGLEGKGFDRLDLALENIRTKGEMGGTAQVEAMMNFFGYIRGGVPAKNETDLWNEKTRTLWTMLDNVGMAVGVQNLGRSWTGSEKDELTFKAGLKQLPEAQREQLEAAIQQSRNVLYRIAEKNVVAQMESFKSLGRPGHERAQDQINAKMRFMGAKPRQWFPDSPLIPDYDPGAQSQPASGAGSSPSAPAPKQGGVSLKEALGL